MTWKLNKIMDTELAAAHLTYLMQDTLLQEDKRTFVLPEGSGQYECQTAGDGTLSRKGGGRRRLTTKTVETY